MVQAGGGAEDDAYDEEPRVGAEPFVEEPAKATERHDYGDECNACRVREAGFSILFLIGRLGHRAHQLSRVR